MIWYLHSIDDNVIPWLAVNRATELLYDIEKPNTQQARHNSKAHMKLQSCRDVFGGNVRLEAG